MSSFLKLLKRFVIVDTIEATEAAIDKVIGRIGTTWSKFRDLESLSSIRGLLIKVKSTLYST